MELAQGLLGAIAGVIGGRLVVVALNRMALPQGLHAPFVTTAALVIFGVAQISHASGFLAVYLAGIIIGNRPTRAHNSVVTFLDAATWLAQIVMFVLLGLLASPQRLLDSVGPSVIVALVLMLVRGRSRCCCASCHSGSTGGKRSSSPGPACAGRSRSFSPRSRCWSGCRRPISISTSPLSWSSSRCCCRAGRWGRRRGGCTWRCRASTGRRRVELDLPGQLEQQLVGYPVRSKSLYFRRGLLPSWSKPTLVIRDERILSPVEADPVAAGDYIYLLAPPREGRGAGSLLRRHGAELGAQYICSAISWCRASTRSVNSPRSTAYRLGKSRLV